MAAQDWEGLDLDKDLLVPGNKVYGPETCIFVVHSVNAFLIDSAKARGQWPLGVSWRTRDNKFSANCNNPFTKRMEFLGYFTDPNEAHQAWKARKLEHAIALACQQTDERVAMALVARYC